MENYKRYGKHRGRPGPPGRGGGSLSSSWEGEAALRKAGERRLSKQLSRGELVDGGRKSLGLGAIEAARVHSSAGKSRRKGSML